MIDPDLHGVFARAAEMVDVATNAQAAADHLAGEAALLRAEVDALGRARDTAQGEAAFWRGRAQLMAKALRLWQRYDGTAKSTGKHGPKGLAQARAYCAALSATQEAMAAFKTPDQLH